MNAHPSELTVGRPRRGALGSIADSLTALVKRRRLIWYLANSSLRSKGASSLFGNAWLIIDPALQLAIYYVLVGVILRRPEPAFPLFLFAAILPWRWFTQAISSSTESVRKMGKVMQQIVFPQIVLPFASIGASFGSFVFGFIPLDGPLSDLPRAAHGVDPCASRSDGCPTALDNPDCNHLERC